MHPATTSSEARRMAFVIVASRKEVTYYDRPLIYGAVAGGAATMKFRSAWTGAFGVATITLDKSSIAWHVVKPIGEQNWYPRDAPLNRGASRLFYRTTICGDAPNNPRE